jgi:hypothetical protein
MGCLGLLLVLSLEAASLNADWGLPDALSSHLRETHPELRIPAPEDLRAGWAESVGEQSPSFLCRGDFDGNVHLSNESYWELR